MAELNKKELLVLKVLHDHAIETPHNPEMRYYEIRDSTFEQFQDELDLTNKQSWGVMLSNTLTKLWKKEKLIDKQVYGHQDVRYKIRDLDRVKLILGMAHVGLKPPEKELAFKLKVPMSTKTKHEIIERLSKLLYDLIFAEKVPRLPYSPVVMGFSEPGDLLRDKIIFIAPDPASAKTIQQFSMEEFEELLKYLMTATSIYLKPEPRRGTIGQVVIAKLEKDEVAAIESAIERKVVDRVDEAVRVAIAEWCKKEEGKQPFRVSVTEHRPNLKKALHEGRLESPRKAVEYALDLLERRLEREG